MKKNVVETSRKKSCVVVDVENMVVQNRSENCGNCIYYEFKGNGEGWCQTLKQKAKSGEYCRNHTLAKK